MILFSLAGIFLIGILGSLFSDLFSLFLDKTVTEEFGVAAAGITVLLLFRLWFSPQFKGQSRSGLSLKWTLLMSLPGIIYIIYLQAKRTPSICNM